MICFYHGADFDGKCSAAVVKYKYPECRLFPVDHGKPFPWHEIKQGEKAFMVDFSLSIDRMLHLAKKTELIWIDNHTSSIKDAIEAGFNPAGIRVLGKSGCELTWEYLFKGELTPTVVHLLGRFDVHDLTDTRTLPFQYGFNLEDVDPNNVELWSRLFEGDVKFVDHVISNGVPILAYKTYTDSDTIKRHAFDAEFDGLKALVVNTGVKGSGTFDSRWDPEKYDIMLTFVITPAGVSGSMYTTKENLDLSKVARKFGGGGRPQASGYSFNNIDKFFKVLSYK